MAKQNSILVLAALVSLCLGRSAEARLPPPPVSMDKMLEQAGVIVVGKVKPGSLRRAKDEYLQLTLLVARVLKGKAAKEITVVMGNIPAREFPKSEKHPNGRLLLTGWDMDGHLERAEQGLDLYAEQVWFLEQFPDHPSLRAPKAPYGVSKFESVRDRAHAPLINLLVTGARVAELRKMIDKGYGGKTPLFVVEALYGSRDPDAGAFLWDCLKPVEERELALQKMTKAQQREERIKEYEDRDWRMLPWAAFRAINSLGREEALKWCRKAQSSSHEAIRACALEVLKRYPDPESAPALIKMFASAKDDEKQSLVDTLGFLGDHRAIPIIIDWLAHVDGEALRKTQHALFRLTDLRLSPSGTLARDWWEHNKEKPRWHWLKQGIEQDLLLLVGQPTTDWRDDLHPLTHLERVTCWKQPRNKDQAEAWAKWWQVNRDIAQEQWIIDSFRAVGHPLPDLKDADAVEALLRILETPPSHWWDKGPVLDTYLHPVWCTRLLSRLTGLSVVDTHYLHHHDHFYLDGKVEGPKWRALWEKHRRHIKLHPIVVSAKQEFRLTDADRRLIAQDLQAIRPKVELEGPLLEKPSEKQKEKELLATFKLTLTNTTDMPLILATAPSFAGSNQTVRWSSGLHTEDFACLVKGEFVTLRPGESLRWRTRQHIRFAEKDDPSRFQFRLSFDERGPDGTAWRGLVHTPWIAVPPDTPVHKN